MFLFFSIIVFCLIGDVFVLKTKDIDNRIYNGLNAIDGQFPYMVLLIFDYRQQNEGPWICSGALIQFHVILTTAHCLLGVKPQDTIVMVGKADAADYVDFRLSNPFKRSYPSDIIQESLASQIIAHPKHERNYDLGVVKVARPFNKTKFVNTIKVTTDEYPGNLPCYILGFGANNESEGGHLRYFQVNSVSDDLRECGSRLNERLYYCLKHTSSPSSSTFCKGDTGAPLVCNGAVYGVNSESQIRRFKKVCGTPAIMKFFKLSLSEKEAGFVVKFVKAFESKSCHALPKFSVFFYFCLITFLTNYK